MSLHLRIPKAVLDEVRVDIVRPHPFAAERIGFLKARLGSGKDDDRIVLLNGYSRVNDAHYIDDPHSGARIDGNAIRSAMQTILEEDVGLFHVHLHDWPGIPGLGRMDKREIPELVRTFRSTAPQRPHGIFLLSRDNFSCWIWLPGENDPRQPDRTTVVGMPLVIKN